MKTIALITGMLFAVLTVNAQWYANQYGVTNMNELNQDQLEYSLEKATKMKKVGVGVTIASTIVTIVGSVMYANGLDDIVESTTYNSIYEGADRAYGGLAVATIGGIGMCVGIPLWIAGAQRSNVVQLHLRKFQPTGQVIPSIGFTYTF